MQLRCSCICSQASLQRGGGYSGANFQEAPSGSGVSRAEATGVPGADETRKLSFGGLTCITWGPLAINSHVCAERKLRLPEPDRIRLIGTPKAGGADCGVER